jgi:hypothetical protein
VTRRALAVPAVLLAAVAALLLERWIVTDREAVEELLHEAAEAAERGDWHAVRAAIDDDFEGMDPDAFVARAHALSTAGASGWSLRVDDVAVEGDRASARVEVRFSPFSGASPWNTAGSVGLVRAASGWRIRSVSPDDPRWLR